MFSNGTEYDCFLERNCEDCRFYVPWEEATKKKPECHIEERIARSSMLDRDEALTVFPFEWLEDNGSISRYDCRRKSFKKKRFLTADKLPKYAPPMTQEQANELFKDFMVKE